MFGKHHIQQLPIEAFRSVFNFCDVETGFDIQIFGTRAMLKIEVDDASSAALFFSVTI